MGPSLAATHDHAQQGSSHLRRALHSHVEVDGLDRVENGALVPGLDAHALQVLLGQVADGRRDVETLIDEGGQVLNEADAVQPLLDGQL
jgi:hypothetical protein